MTSEETLSELPCNGLRVPSLSAPFNHEPSHHSDQTVLTDPVFKPKRSSQRDKNTSIVPDSISPKLKRRTSRFGLSSLFSRSKPLASKEVQERLGVQWECDESTGTSIGADPGGLPINSHRPSAPESQDLPQIVPPAVPLRNRASRTALRPKPSFRRESTSSGPTAWDPPPLFQAYPQSVRHATLRVPTLSAETILRLNAESSSSSNRRVESYTPEVYEMKSSKEKKLRKPSALDVLSKGDWTDKTFVLVTSGYFLQYAGQGPFDRLPEKIMPLSKDSAAFASDAIPGKPYVLQVSQVSDEDGTLDTEASRSMFKSLGLRSQMKRSTSSFLLVFESPDELSVWMVAVRKEIQTIGGKESRPDASRRPAEEGSTQGLSQGPSHRYLVKRNPNQFSQIPDPVPNVPFSDHTLAPEHSKQFVDPADPTCINRQSMATQQSVDSRTTSNTAESINRIHLDRLRESPRQSYASTAGRTTSTSRDSSPGPSPVNLYSDLTQRAPNLNERRQTTSMYHGLVRSSMQRLPSPHKRTTSPSAPSSSHRISNCTPQQQRTPSPAAPNFSVPTFSKRYSYSNTSPTLSYTKAKPQTPPVSLIHVSPSPPIIDEEEEGTAKRASIIGELQHLQIPSTRASNSFLPSISTPPRSAGSCGPPSSSEGDRPFSRRFSSLEYSRGISPLQVASQSPSPHPPPTTALPAIPGSHLSSRASFIKPPLAPLPPLPDAEDSEASSTTRTSPTALPACPSTTRLPSTFITGSPSPPSPPPTVSPENEPSQGEFPYPPPTKALPDVPDVILSLQASMLPSPPRTPSYEATTHEPPRDFAMSQAKLFKPIASKIEAPHQRSLIQKSTVHELMKKGPTGAQSLRRPASMQVRSQPPADHAAPQTAFKTTFDLENITPPVTESVPSPPRPTRHPPPPPSPLSLPLEQRPQLVICKSSPRIGREPPPVSALPSPKSGISTISPATNYFDEAAPHSFIPPIKVSERKFRGSLDGPWNPAYRAHQRTCLDLGAV